jgi:small nuclear ribonucleoprotein (snRNP)-like protein
MDILEMATNSGLLVTLDGRIGLEEYRSVYGSLSALDRFANAILDYARGQDPAGDVLNESSSYPTAR